MINDRIKIETNLMAKILPHFSASQGLITLINPSKEKILGFPFTNLRDITQVKVMDVLLNLGLKDGWE